MMIDIAARSGRRAIRSVIAGVGGADDSLICIKLASPAFLLTYAVLY